MHNFLVVDEHAEHDVEVTGLIGGVTRFVAHSAEDSHVLLVLQKYPLHQAIVFEDVTLVYGASLCNCRLVTIVVIILMFFSLAVRNDFFQEFIHVVLVVEFVTQDT